MGRRSRATRTNELIGSNTDVSMSVILLNGRKRVKYSLKLDSSLRGNRAGFVSQVLGRGFHNDSD